MVGFTIALVMLPLSQERFRYRVVMLVVSAQRGKWVGGVQQDKETAQCRRAFRGDALAMGSSERGLLQWTSFSSG